MNLYEGLRLRVGMENGQGPNSVESKSQTVRERDAGREMGGDDQR